MAFDPASFDPRTLFRDPDMFDSADDWGGAGFKILRASDNKICVASHKSAEGYLFKKYVASGKREALDDQLENYQTRIEGARRLRSFINDQRLRHVVVPSKWLRDLPRDFGSRGQSSHVLVVDRLDLLDDDASQRRYGDIDEDVLRELCVVLHAFRGLDSTAKNVPFTRDGRIAFIDTEHWNRHSKREKRSQRPFLKYLREHLTSDRRRLAGKMLGDLDGSSSSDFDYEESTSSSS